ncbi:MAG: hypothetical protein K6U74_01010 [Firmicutes bacterium]|nr:hypothetical protein [Bacillota bacterium]
MAQEWDVRRVYLYLVCLVTLMMVIMGTVMTIRGVVDFIYPYERTYTPKPYYEAKTRLQREPGISDEQYRQQLKEMEQQIAQERRANEINEKRNRVRNLINNFALIAVALPIFTYHWRKIRQFESTFSGHN